MRSLLGEVHTAHQSLKARLGAQWIEAGIYPRTDQFLVLLFNSPLHPCEGCVFVANAEIGAHKQSRRDITMSSNFVELLEVTAQEADHCRHGMIPFRSASVQSIFRVGNSSRPPRVLRSHNNSVVHQLSVSMI
jgi:hypothetical protein